MAWLCRGALGLKDQQLLKDRKWEDKLVKKHLVAPLQHIKKNIWTSLPPRLTNARRVYMFLSLIWSKHLTEDLIKYIKYTHTDIKHFNNRVKLNESDFGMSNDYEDDGEKITLNKANCQCLTNQLIPTLLSSFKWLDFYSSRF